MVFNKIEILTLSKLQTSNGGIYLMCSNKIQAEILIATDDLTEINKVATEYVEIITSPSKVTAITVIYHDMNTF